MKSTKKVVIYFKPGAKCAASAHRPPYENPQKTAQISTVVFYENVFTMLATMPPPVYGNLR